MKPLSSFSADSFSEEPILKYTSSDESSGSDAECIFCTGLFSEDKKGEKWAKCVKCLRGAHEDCGELRSSIFTCSFPEGKGFFE